MSAVGLKQLRWSSRRVALCCTEHSTRNRVWAMGPDNITASQSCLIKIDEYLCNPTFFHKRSVVNSDFFIKIQSSLNRSSAQISVSI